MIYRACTIRHVAIGGGYVFNKDVLYKIPVHIFFTFLSYFVPSQKHEFIIHKKRTFSDFKLINGTIHKTKKMAWLYAAITRLF